MELLHRNLLQEEMQFNARAIQAARTADARLKSAGMTTRFYRQLKKPVRRESGGLRVEVPLGVGPPSAEERARDPTEREQEDGKDLRGPATSNSQGWRNKNEFTEHR